MWGKGVVFSILHGWPWLDHASGVRKHIINITSTATLIRSHFGSSLVDSRPFWLGAAEGQPTAVA
eukprot:9849012-Lingulodinium_polyedra.AAC.1